MRSVDVLRRLGLVGTVCVVLGACAAISEPAKNAPQAGAAPAPAGRPADKAAPAPAAGGEVAPDLSPEVVHAYDAALRALQQGHAPEAERGFLALTRSNPELGGPHANLGLIYRRADKSAQAVAELELAVRANPKQPVYWNQLGIAYRQQGQFGKAREAYERSIGLDPSYATPNLNLGILFDLYLWDSKRALELYDRYLVLSGGDEKVSKWVADLKNRNRERTAVSRKEQE